MSKEASDSSAIGFLSVRKHTELGYFGGMLLLNPLGRPLEFHCTLPIKPTRAQEILYGPTLDPFLCGEQIGFALHSKSSIPPVLYVTDRSTILTLRNLIDTPVLFVKSDGYEEEYAFEEDESQRIPFDISHHHVEVLACFSADQPRILKIWKDLSPRMDLVEPFGRISEALFEAHPSTRVA